MRNLNPNSRILTSAARKFRGKEASTAPESEGLYPDALPAGDDRDTIGFPDGIPSGPQETMTTKGQGKDKEDPVSELCSDTSAKCAPSIGLFPIKPVPEKAYREDFAAWWNLYAKKVGKAVAEKLFAAALKKTDAATLLIATRRYVDATPEVRFRKNPEKWLKEKHWRDEPVPANERPPGRPSKPEAFADFADTPGSIFVRRYRAGEIDRDGNEIAWPRPALRVDNFDGKTIEGEAA